MNNREEIINNFYQEYNEEERLVKDKTHNLEYIISRNYIDRYLKAKAKILEVGAGTGRYSLHYAKQGYDVTAIEYVAHNLDVLKSNIEPNMIIKAEQGDAIDLSRFDDNEFDVTLILGPLYHLYDDKDIDQAINEAIRVTKPQGLIAIAYLTSDGVFADWAIDHLLDGYPKDFDANYKLIRYPEGIFAPFYITEFKQLMSKYPVTLLHNIATDGIARTIADKINNLSEAEYQVWIKYQLSVCERVDLQGYSCHMLYLCRKN